MCRVRRRADGGRRGESSEAVEQIGRGTAAEPENVFAAGNLAEIDADLAEGVCVGAVLAAGDENARERAVDGGLQESVVRGEGLQEGGVVAVAREDGDGLARRKRFDETRELDVEVHLIRQLEVGGVEQDDVQDGREVLVVVVDSGGRG